jgi:hypothetical protein
MSTWSYLLLVHLVGLALGVGGASVKLLLLLRFRSDYAFVPTYLKIAKPITRLIQIGLVLMTLSGIYWIFYYDLSITTLLAVKIVLVLGIWVIGPIIDFAIEPRYASLAPKHGEPARPAFLRIQKQYLGLETAATALFYAIVVIGVRL